MSQPIGPQVAWQLKSVGDPSLSPDGHHLAYTFGWYDEAAEESRSRISVLELATGRTQEFTQGDSDSIPKYSPEPPSS